MPDLTELHRIAQARIGERTVDAMRTVWPLLDRTALDATTTRWLSAAAAVVAENRLLSAKVAAGYLTAHKAEALGADAVITPRLASAITPRAVATSLMVTGPVALKRAARNGLPFAIALERAFGTSSAAAMRHALNGGRSTISRTIGDDDDADGWRRVTSGRACKFCTEIAATGELFRETSAYFAAHDGCACSAEPVWAA